MAPLRTLRLIVFGFGGGVIWFGAMLGLLASVAGEKTTVSPLLIAVVFILSSLAMLYGTEQWGRWAYLLVFFSIPAALVFVALLPDALLAELALLPVVIPLAAAFGTYHQVRSYYARRIGTSGAGSESPREETSHPAGQAPERSSGGK